MILPHIDIISPTKAGVKLPAELATSNYHVGIYNNIVNATVGEWHAF